MSASAMKKRYIRAATWAILLVFVLYTAVILRCHTFYGGVHVGGYDISGLTLQQAYNRLSSRYAELTGDGFITFRCENSAYRMKLSAFSFSIPLGEVLKEAYTVGRNGFVLGRLYDIAKCFIQKPDFTVVPSYDRSELQNLVHGLKKELYLSPSDAYVEYKNGKVILTPGNEGSEVDIEKTMASVCNNLNRFIFSDMQLVFKTIIPKVTTDDIKNIDAEISAFSTWFNMNDKNRTDNIRQACKSIDTKVVKPGEVFSLSGVLGPRTRENGYLDAPIILKNELVQGTGGGVCQVATTLYNAILYAGLDVLERHHHSFPPAYVDPGRDATLAEGSMDLKFRNNLEHSIALSASADGNRLLISILGATSDRPERMRLVSTAIKEYMPEDEEVIVDGSLPYGERIVVREARKGMNVRVYAEYLGVNGIIVSKKLISNDVYNPIKAVVKVSENYYN